MSPVQIMYFKLALTSLHRLTPFAYMTVIGAVSAVAGFALCLGDADGKPHLHSSPGDGPVEQLADAYETMREAAEPKKPAESRELFIQRARMGMAMLVVGVILFGIGLLPFVSIKD